MGEDQADGDRLRFKPGDGVGDALGLRLRQRRHHIAEGVDALGCLDGAGARHHGRRLRVGQGIEVRPLLIADHQDVAEARRGDEGDLGAIAGQEGVGADGEAMDEEIDIAGLQARLRRDALDTLGDAGGRAGCLRRHLVQMHAPGAGGGIDIDQHQIGECSAYIGREIAHFGDRK